ncbi:AMP-binding protein [uncultured Psychroserpens sp.]|uniref:AMP-binding protein n=1 Tax=uncultured Psychroserpens sp. TaxID=255436 RepID=UPI00261052BA|nr:AMP-binding protein [uncultured Psychroserpens sp.]
MTPTFDKVHLKFKLNGISYDHNALKEVAYSLVKEGESYEKVVGDFLLDWLNDKDFLLVKTSGSTGMPKIVELKKAAMVNSAIMTGDYFDLQPGDKALHCLPSRYISGKMMLVRAMILGLELDMVAPTLSPIIDDKKNYDFCAMIPLQVKKSIHHLKQIKTLIIGGASVSSTLIDKFQNLSTLVYETYGMTETVSHIAVKRLNPKPAGSFQLLPSIRVSIDDRSCLIVDAPKLAANKIVTNDIVELITDQTFKLLGRYDNMINSGGVKVFPELVELKLHDLIEERFFIASKEDKDLGEKLILVIEGETNHIDKDVFSQLEKFEIPKMVYNIPKFIETETGKLKRKKILEAVLS